jgi:hypothetical protein
MKSKLFMRPTMAALASLVLAGFVMVAALGSRTASPAAKTNEATDRNIVRMTAGLLEHSQISGRTSRN